MSAADYLAWEREQPAKHEYHRGEASAMAGGKPRHKWEAYQRLPSLTDYLLVAQSSTRVEHYRREDDGSWRYRVLAAGDTVTLANGAAVSVDAVYEGAFDLVAD